MDNGRSMESSWVVVVDEKKSKAKAAAAAKAMEVMMRREMMRMVVVVVFREDPALKESRAVNWVGGVESISVWLADKIKFSFPDLKKYVISSSGWHFSFANQVAD